MELLPDSIHDDYLKFPRLRALVAHEFSHACQYRYRDGGADDVWFMENTSVYMEHKIYNSPDDIYRLPDILSGDDNPLFNPYYAIDRITGGEVGAPGKYVYAGGLWPTFLDEFFQDDSIVSKIWHSMGTDTNKSVLEAIHDVLFQNGGLPNALSNYAIWRYFTGSRADNQHFENASLYDTSDVTYVDSNYASNWEPPSEKRPSVNGGTNFIEVLKWECKLIINFNGADGCLWDVSVIQYNSGEFSNVEKIVLDENNDGSISIWANNCDHIVIIPTVISWGSSNNSYSYSYSIVESYCDSILFANRNSNDDDLGGKLLRAELDTVNSGSSLWLEDDTDDSIRTLNERFIRDSILKHNNWNTNSALFRLKRTYNTRLNPEVLAQFEKVHPVIIRNELIDAPHLNGGKIEFRDPWYLHSNGTQPDSFFTYDLSTDPLKPTGAYNEISGGVFLDQRFDQPNNPYYSVRNKINQSIGYYQNCRFIGWISALDTAQFKYPDSTETPIIFKLPNDTIKALYKSNMITSSSSALIPTTHRKVLLDNFNTPYMVYESGNGAFWTKSTDGGNTWISEQSVEGPPTSNVIYHDPSIIPRDSVIPILYEKVEKYGSSWTHNVRIKPFGYDPVDITDSGFDTVKNFRLNPVGILSKPISGKPSVLFVAWIAHGTICYKVCDGSSSNFELTSSYYGYDFHNYHQIPINNPKNLGVSIAVDANRYYFYFVWEEPSGIKFGSGWLTDYPDPNDPNQINWDSIYTIASNTTTDTNRTPVVAVDGSDSVLITWAYKTPSSSQIKFQKRSNGYARMIASSIEFPSYPGCLQSNPSITTNEAHNIKLTWSASGFGIAAAYYQGGYNAGWSSPYIIPSTSDYQMGVLGKSISSSSNYILYLSNQGSPYDLTCVWDESTPIPPPIPSLSSPTDSAQNVALNPNLIWNPSFAASTYRLQVSRFSNFSTTVIDSSGITGTSCQMIGLMEATSHYWRVCAINSNDTSDWSSVWCFTTCSIPPAPTLSSPANGATNVPTTTTLSWNSSTGATSYRLQVSTQSNFSTTWKDQSGITGTSYQVSGLNYTTVYYWRVNATNGCGTSNWSNTWSFTTCSAPPPGCPYISSWNGDHYILDNNVLQLSEYYGNKGMMVTDFYKLNVAPNLTENEYILELSEFEEERSTIDQVKLLAIDHDQNTDIAVLPDGKIIEYKLAFKIKEGGCQCLGYEEKLSSFDGKAHYTSQGEKFIMSFEPVLADYATLENLKVGVLLGGWLDVYNKRPWAPAPPPKEQSVGDLVGNEISILKPTFTFRQRGTLVYIPLADFSTNIVISFSKRVGFDYASLVAEVPNPTFIVQELMLKNAMHSNLSNVAGQLQMKDGFTEDLYPDETIKLIYSSVPIEHGKVRSFVLVTTGLYEHVGVNAKRIPLQFRLDESYPNPFNPQTTVKYTLSQSGHVSISIYNQLGQEITKIVDQEQDVGYHERHWDAANVPSGTYYVQMIVRDQSGKHLFQETKKLLLMK